MTFLLCFVFCCLILFGNWKQSSKVTIEALVSNYQVSSIYQICKTELLYKRKSIQFFKKYVIL